MIASVSEEGEREVGMRKGDAFIAFGIIAFDLSDLTGFTSLSSTLSTFYIHHFRIMQTIIKCISTDFQVYRFELACENLSKST